MNQHSIDNQIAQEQVIRDGISTLLETICSKAAPIYPHICARANRSAEDRRKIIDMVFELLVAENSTMTADSAIAKVESELDWDQE